MTLILNILVFLLPLIIFALAVIWAMAMVNRARLTVPKEPPPASWLAKQEGRDV